MTDTVLVIGAGAVGSFLGGTLALAGRDVTLLGRQAAAGNPEPEAEPGPLVIDGPDGRRTPTIRRVGDPDLVAEAPSLIVLAVKAYDVPGALETAARWPEVPVLAVQNGVGAEAGVIASRSSPVLAGSLTTAVVLVEGGVAARRRGGIGLATIRGATADDAEALAAAFRAGGLPAKVCPDAAAMKWSKLLANLVGNASSALLDMEPRTIYREPAGFELERRQIREALAVMRAEGLRPITLPGAHIGLLLAGMRLPAPIARPIMARAIGGARGGKSPSLRLRLRGGGAGPTEAPWLNGAVAAAGQRLGVPVPVNALFAALVEAAVADSSLLDAFTCRPDRLLAAADRAAGVL